MVHHRFLQNNNYIGRPVDVMNMLDGSMLISAKLT
jgi:glucose/arabinose dehydrogenase